MTEDKEFQVKVLNSTFYKEDCEFEGFFPPRDDYPDLHEILSEYSTLIGKSDISERDADRISEILELAEHDRLLDECIDKIDRVIKIQSEIQPKKLSIEELLAEFKKLSEQKSSNDSFMRDFAELVKKFDLKPDFINNFIEFNSSSYNQQLVLNNRRFALYVICWKPGDETKIECNFRYSTVNFVYRGHVTKTIYTPIVIDGYREDKEVLKEFYKQGQWFSNKQYEFHKLANKGAENLVTIHFKYFNVDPNEREIEEITDISDERIVNGERLNKEIEAESSIESNKLLDYFDRDYSLG